MQEDENELEVAEDGRTGLARLDDDEDDDAEEQEGADRLRFIVGGALREEPLEIAEKLPGQFMAKDCCNESY